MISEIEPLRFPGHFPPKSFWKKFFIGVRWLGPDISFFEDIEAQQGARNKAHFDIWGGGMRQELAAMLSTDLCELQKWRTNIFIPQDKLDVIWNGPRFQSLDDLAFEHALRVVEKKYGIKIPCSFWKGMENATFGEFVDKLVALGIRP